jgi:hypothetical protein
MRTGRLAIVVFLSLLGGDGLFGQSMGSGSTAGDESPGDPQVGFRYENAQLQPAKYSLVVHEDGSGHYHSEPGSTPPADTPSYHPLAQAQDRPIRLSPPMVEKIFSTARSAKFFANGCEEPKSKIAFQGTKELSYQGPDGKGSCTYNWPKSVSLQKLTAIFESIAFTLEEGRRLDIEHKHDRLGLDAELGDLSEGVKEGRALEIQNIRSTLQEIIDDDTVMERVRSRAGKLLDGTNTSSQ